MKLEKNSTGINSTKLYFKMKYIYKKQTNVQANPVPKFNNININKIVSQKEIHIKNKLLYRLTMYQNSTIKTTFPKFIQPRNKIQLHQLIQKF